MNKSKNVLTNFSLTSFFEKKVDLYTLHNVSSEVYHHLIFLVLERLRPQIIAEPNQNINTNNLVQ
jgi:hypothetical protein